MNKNSPVLVTLCTLAGAVAVWLGMQVRGAPEAPRRHAVVAAPTRLQPETDSAVVERQDVTPSATESSVDAESATDLVDALQHPKAEITVKPLAGSGLSQEVVDGMTQLMTKQLPTMQWNIEYRPESEFRYYHEFLFALWPDLGPRIAKGEIEPKVVRIPDHGPFSNVPRDVVWVFTKKEDKFDIVFNTENGWQVVLTFLPKGNPLPELYKQLVAAHYTTQESRR